MGPDSDVQTGKPVTPQGGSWRPVVAIAVGALIGFSFVSRGPMGTGWVQISQFLARRASAAQTSTLSKDHASRAVSQGMQKRAELLLGRDVNHSSGAHEEIAARVEGWRGRLTLTPQLNSLLSAALNSNDFEVRKDGIEVDLATMGLIKTPQSADQLIRQASTGPNSQRMWALWTMGLLGNRGVDRTSSAGS